MAIEYEPFDITQSGSQLQTALDKVGTSPLATTAQDLSEAINELDGEVAQNTQDISDNASDIASLLNLVPTLGTISDHAGSCTIGDFLIQWGSATFTPTANAVTTHEIEFPIAFANAPWLGITVRSTAVNQVTGFGCTSTSTTGSILRIYRTSATSTTLGWCAIGKKAGGGSLNSINPITPINLNPLSPSVVNEEEEM